MSDDLRAPSGSGPAAQDDGLAHAVGCDCGRVSTTGASVTENPADLRCTCGALLGRRTGDQIELVCRRCKRRIVLVVKEVRLSV